MEDFNSETDSDYTSYWRDWCGRGDCGLGVEDEGTGQRLRTVLLQVNLGDNGHCGW
ncbi:uncharacterized protein ACLA_025550 [Aspergillus clavatus NRRL 1]|uniref:Uncharacterized protein n=1 Tax=Aspergillus clavatus (strain ATCC 1007 / CBS 513.65 / DSM 816 / NCTC 3887 / NRRL 1 / QM 1276 / 107) TaxID=344612 RepID=A1CQB7_ASPCL|nr:uncharacterized protein ACLA_025550 [Aspergillus clavatus NRRL 1]EAW07838.1 hypothetical protein ACLA_025550 [Aspergillus clavatus NRRL 1]